MKIQTTNFLADPALAQAIDSFEQQFSYPLGTNSRFTISHGDNYSCFYQSMGESQSLIAQDNGIVYGAISATIRTIISPKGTKVIGAYIGDFKVAEQVRGTSAAYHLLKEIQAWILSRTKYAFCIVMNGTASSPLDYTGRLGIKKFQPLGQVSILRITLGESLLGQSLPVLEESDASALYKSLVQAKWSMLSGKPTMRSTIDPQWLTLENLSACGRLEDTRKAKRLFTLANEEILAAHLANFAYLTPAAGAELIMLALAQAGQYGYTSIFVAVNPEDVCSFREALSAQQITEARASIFGNLPNEATKAWSINTSEI